MKFKIIKSEIDDIEIVAMLFLNNTDEEIVICTDTREICNGDIFLALKGDLYNGHEFVQEAINAGAGKVIVSRNEKYNQAHRSHLIIVDNSLLFMHKLAKLKLKNWRLSGGRVICLTGSNGKTTNKEIIFELLNNSRPGKIAATIDNFNNHIGVPLTIFNLKNTDEIAIIEMGTNHPGEIKVLSDIVNPEFGYITNIGDSHLEFFNDRDGVLKEKSELYYNCIQNSKENKKFFVNLYDDYLKKIKLEKGSVKIGKDFDWEIEIVNAKLKIITGDRTVEIPNKKIKEDYNLFNLGMCFIIASTIYPELESEFITSATNLELPHNNRSTWISYPGKELFLDAYNANPSSMEVSIKSFVKHLEINKISLDRAIFILGDMNETGRKVEFFHEQLAKKLNTYGITNVAFIGKYRDYYLKGYAGKDQGDESLDGFLNKWSEIYKKYDYFFIKGSRSVSLEKLIDNINT